MQLFDLTGRSALVLGGNGVLGSALVKGLAAHGARVAIAGRDQDKARAVRAELVQSGHDAEAFYVDLTARSSLEQLQEQVGKWAGHLDILVHCAGINSKKPFLEVTDEDWDDIFTVNVKSAFQAAQIFGKQMMEDGGGSIIHISSVSSLQPLSGVFAYSASKAALNNATQYLAREFAPIVRVNAIIPGFFPAEQNRKILTKERVDAIYSQTPMGRLGEPTELQGTVVWLASEQASGFVTGALIPVDGGFTAMKL
ncbi:MAG: SDR family oxidoreductase [Firmicutes bacterium]|nr:SDR family oxidoreductase [Bacillota bacterium]